MYYMEFIPVLNKPTSRTIIWSAIRRLDATQARVSSRQKANEWSATKVFTGHALACGWDLAGAGRI